MKKLSEKIIEQLQSKHDGFLGTEGELSRQSFKDGLSWAIDTIETLTYVDNCEKEHEAEQLRIAVVSSSAGFRENANPLLKYLVENHHPHTTAIITSTSIELLEGIKAENKIYDYIQD